MIFNDLLIETRFGDVVVNSIQKNIKISFRRFCSFWFSFQARIKIIRLFVIWSIIFAFKSHDDFNWFELHSILSIIDQNKFVSWKKFQNIQNYRFRCRWRKKIFQNFWIKQWMKSKFMMRRCYRIDWYDEFVVEKFSRNTYECKLCNIAICKLKYC